MSLGDRPPEPLSAAEVHALLACCDGTTLTGMRNRALIVVMWRAGLRCAEALALRPSDIDPEAGTIRVLRGKGRKARTVGVDAQAMLELKVWIGARANAGLNGGPLFCQVHPTLGGVVSARYVRAMVTRLGARAGIAHRVHPHGLRHTHAVELVREGWPVNMISRQLGHSNIATTSVYIDHLHPGEVVDRARARQWWGL